MALTPIEEGIIVEFKTFAEIQKREHEQVNFFYYPEVGLKAVVGIHNTVLGPALGGCRMRIYENEAQAIEDALRLSEGMTYKSAIAGLDLGGGKAVLIADPAMTKGRRELFLKLGECFNHLAGRYITAEDMGTGVDDVMVMREKTKHVAGISPAEGGGGDPSPWTARGVFKSIIAACERQFNSKDISGKRVAVQGVGHVGMYLVKLLREAGASVVVCDTHSQRVEEAKRLGATVCSIDSIYDQPCDVYAPCAAGQTVNPSTIQRLSCPIIAGAANNQLLDSGMYSLINAKKILYCPDFVVNAGGVINVGAEYVAGGYKQAWVQEKVDAIYHTIHKILDESEKRGKFPEVVAIELAKERIAKKKAAQG